MYSVDMPVAKRREYAYKMTDHLHILAEVKVLNTNYERRWIARSGLMTCPTRSPNLNSRFLLWGYMKSGV
jgi:hypothetical protein